MIFLLIFTFRRFKKYDGQLFWIYFAFYGINRSIIEIFRGDFRGDFIFEFLSLSQGIGLVVSCVALIFMIIKFRSGKGA